MFDRLFVQRARDKFASRMMKTLREAGNQHQITYDQAEFSLNFSKDGTKVGTFALGDLYAEYCNAAKAERPKLLRQKCIPFGAADVFDDPMTEAEWLVSEDPWRMLRLLEHSTQSERKIRLFNAAICRRFWQYLPPDSQAVLHDSELLADGLIAEPNDKMELCTRANIAVAPFHRLYPANDFPSDEIRIQRNAAAAVCYAVIPGDLWGAISYFWELDPSEKQPHSIIIRDVFGNPFHSPVLEPCWRPPEIITLARTIYDEKAFGRLPELGEALEAAGCRSAEILEHCDGQEPHVRGCWLVDILLGKE